MKIKPEKSSRLDKISLVVAFLVLLIAIGVFYWIVIRTPRAKSWCHNWASTYFQPLSEEKYRYRYEGCLAAHSLKGVLSIKKYWLRIRLCKLLPFCQPVY